MHKPYSETIELAKALIQCPSVTPNDANCQAILAKRLEKLGFSIYSLPFGDVQNLWAIRSSLPGPLFVFAGHTDVVPAGNLNDWATPPFTPSINGEYLYGRGAADMKGSLAAMITATERFIEHFPNSHGSIGFLITSDEEGLAENGTVKVVEYLKNQGIKINYCIVGEPTARDQAGDTIKNGRRGSLNGILKILGKQGHVAYPEKADNPIHRALLPLNELSHHVWDQGNEFFPPTTFQIANINAGTGATNVIPAALECQFNFRFNTEVTPEILIEKIKNLLQPYGLQYALNYTVSGYPFLTEPGVLLSACTEACEAIVNSTPALSTNGGTSDARFIAPMGTEVVELGPCNATIHCTNESVKISELSSLTKIYERVLQLLLLAKENE